MHLNLAGSFGQKGDAQSHSMYVYLSAPEDMIAPAPSSWQKRLATEAAAAQVLEEPVTSLSYSPTFRQACAAWSPPFHLRVDHRQPW